MPIYEYACDKCGHEFEAEQRITDDPLKSCPSCRSRKVRRLISRTSFVLKGGGWYSDLYSSSAGKPDKPDKGDSGESKASESKTETKSEPAKSDAKTESSGKSKKKGAKAAA